MPRGEMRPLKPRSRATSRMNLAKVVSFSTINKTSSSGLMLSPSSVEHRTGASAVVAVSGARTSRFNWRRVSGTLDGGGGGGDDRLAFE